VVSVLEGLKQIAGPSVQVEYARGCETTDKNWPESEIFPEPLIAAELAQIEQAVTKARECDVVVAVLGEEETLVGESRSRTSLDLPGRQLQLLQALHNTGKPVILVLINGRPLSINWANRYVPAIIEAWFPGADGGTAVAEAIFGLYNPGGRLPVTFPKSVGQIEYNFPFKPGSHAGQPGDGPNGFGKTNVYGALYPFGHGLSYTTFIYQNLSVNPGAQPAGKDFVITVDVTNTGKYRGDEVVQLYLKDEVSSVTVYETQLRGFERITLDPGETRTVQFTLGKADLELLDKKMNSVVEPGWFEVLLGSSSENIRLKKRFEVTAK
jgi:beta-glucosidase